RMLIGGVIDDQLGDDADAALVRGPHEGLEVAQRAVARMDALVVRDVVPIVTQRRRIEGQQPERVDAEVREVVELRREAGKVAYAVVRAVEKGPDVRLIDDGVLVPEWIVAQQRRHDSRPASVCRTGSDGAGTSRMSTCAGRVSGSSRT